MAIPGFNVAYAAAGGDATSATGRTTSERVLVVGPWDSGGTLPSGTTINAPVPLDDNAAAVAALSDGITYEAIGPILSQVGGGLEYVKWWPTSTASATPTVVVQSEYEAAADKLAAYNWGTAKPPTLVVIAGNLATTASLTAANISSVLTKFDTACEQMLAVGAFTMASSGVTAASTVTLVNTTGSQLKFSNLMAFYNSTTTTNQCAAYSVAAILKNQIANGRAAGVNGIAVDMGGTLNQNIAGDSSTSSTVRTLDAVGVATVVGNLGRFELWGGEFTPDTVINATATSPLRYWNTKNILNEMARRAEDYFRTKVGSPDGVEIMAVELQTHLQVMLRTDPPELQALRVVPDTINSVGGARIFRVFATFFDPAVTFEVILRV